MYDEKYNIFFVHPADKEKNIYPFELNNKRYICSTVFVTKLYLAKFCKNHYPSLAAKKSFISCVCI